MVKKQKTKKDYVRIITNQVEKLSVLQERKKAISDSQKNIIDKINSELNRFCDDRDMKQQAAKDEEVATLLKSAKELVSKLRTLV